MQMVFFNFMGYWGSVDGFGNAFYPTQNLFGINMLRANALSYEPKHYGLALSFLFCLYVIYADIERKKINLQLIIPIALMVVSTGSKSAFLALSTMLVFLLAKDKRSVLFITPILIATFLIFFPEISNVSVGGEYRTLSFLEVFRVQQLDELNFGHDKDIPAILALLEQPLYGFFGVGYGLSPEIINEYSSISAKVANEPNFGLVAFLLNFGVMGAFLTIVVVAHNTYLPFRFAVALFIPSFFLFNLFAFMLALAAVLSINSRHIQSLR